MLPWFLRRLAQSLLLIFILVSVVFFVVRLAPGDPLDQVVDEELGAADRELIRQRLGPGSGRQPGPTVSALAGCHRAG